MLVDKLDNVHLRQRSAGQDGRLLHERLVEIYLVHLEGEMFGHLKHETGSKLNKKKRNSANTKTKNV